MSGKRRPLNQQQGQRPCLLPPPWARILEQVPDTAPKLGRSWCLLGFTILCNNVTFKLSRSTYMGFFTTYILE